MAVDLDNLTQIAEKAHRHICDLSSRKRTWEMSIPANSEHDSDMILEAAVDGLRTLIDRVLELEGACALALEELNRVPCAGLDSWRRAERVCRHVLHGDRLMPGEALGPLPEVEG